MELLTKLFLIGFLTWTIIGFSSWWVYVRYIEKKLHLVSFIFYLPFCLMCGPTLLFLFFLFLLFKYSYNNSFKQWD